ncbi:MAG: NAD(P)-dependent oxidoreductase, partial [Gammaproteobacteria bacterium]|nr:NAD(P)-dependent oxidoreductase [Gammaproteobacteria bacterium]
MKIGFVGLGTMGGNAARNILRKGFALTVYDIRPSAVAALVQEGAEPAENAAAVLAASDVVITMVFGPKEVEQ